MAEFSDKLLLAIQKDESVYDSFFRICREDLPNDADERYQWLRSNGYVARDEADINVYVAKVAYRHAPKFKWLYENLFRKYPHLFQNELDLVVWGCGCGLDLLALYDRALKENNPQLWLSVRSVTLIDISEVALKRAKEIAEVLFPVAKERIKTFNCNFKAVDLGGVSIPESFIYTPRLHLVSNVIDLLSEEQLDRFVPFQRNRCARYYGGKPYFNDFFVSFSPEYRNLDWVSTKLKMERYREKWGKMATEMATVGGEPEACAFAVFSFSSLNNSPQYKSYIDGNRCLRNLARARNRILDKGVSDSHLTRLHGNLSGLSVCGRSFFDSYEWVYEHYYKDMCDGILFVPKNDMSIKACFVSFGEKTFNLCEVVWKEILHRAEFSESNPKDLAKATQTIIWEKSTISKSVEADDFTLDAPCDFAKAFIIDIKGAKPLPDLDCEIDKVQHEIIMGRMQLRRIRGGAGCGKTTTMLWHGIMAIKRTHLPVLMACKTVTLFNHNQRRMAATILAQVPGLEYVDRGLIRFSTIDKFLCDILKESRRCELSNYGYMHRGQTFDHDREAERICASCKANAISGFVEGTIRAQPEDGGFGAVMVDEIQSIEPDKVQALYNLTEAENPNREFYVFCDERQSLESDALEVDEQIKKFRVKTPKGKGGKRFRGDWKSLTKPYRQIGEFSGTLDEVTATFQKLCDEKYGDDETERRLYQPGIVKVFSVERFPRKRFKPGEKIPWDVFTEQPVLASAVVAKIEMLKSAGEPRITVVCDKAVAVYSLLSAECRLGWLSTHKQGASFKEEQRLRNEFEETEDHVGLTTIELAQGWDFENVILIVTQDRNDDEHVVESVLTGITRAKRQLHIIDDSSSGWVYELLKKYN